MELVNYSRNKGEGYRIRSYASSENVFDDYRLKSRSGLEYKTERMSLPKYKAEADKEREASKLSPQFTLQVASTDNSVRLR